jgi:N-acetylated-alpha-linked acidic dipeptidase
MHRNRVTAILIAGASLCALNLLAPPTALAGDSKPLLGFSGRRAAEQRALEARFDALLDRNDLRGWMRRLSARPHHVGSPYGKENAEFIAELFRSWGFDTAIEEFRVLFPTPRLRRLEMTAPVPFTARLVEPPVPGDSTSGQTAEQLPPFNAYSIDGDVTGELVYVNHGVPKDYEELERRGIEVKGKIVLARYGGSWRGIKPKVAAEHGAIGCIIYSDPKEDGFFQGDVYPKGGFRNENSAQRGSVADMPLYAGDPLTPSVGATANAKRLDRKNAKTLTRIPVLPIAYSDALPLLQALGGPMAPEAWRGSLPVPYHLGPGPTRVRLQVAFDWKLVPAYDVIAKMAGAERPNQWIVRGNHHDAWVNGATDPVSGLVALLAEARAVGGLAEQGWKPRRTIVYAAWDGEEPGLLGSTEWVEAHADVLREKAAVYINSDSNARGWLEVGGSHALEVFFNQVGREVLDPEKNIDVIERARAYAISEGSPDSRQAARDRTDLRIAALGSGSDFTPFLQHLGVAALNIGYGGEDDYGQYHSIYDSFSHYVRFEDPNFDYGIVLAQTGGRAVLRLADADVLPFEFARMSDAVAGFLKEVMKLAETMREEIAEKNRRIEDGTYTATFDPTKSYVVPKSEAPVPFLNFAPLQNAVAALERSARAYDKVSRDRAASGKPLAAAQQAALDQVLMKSERALTRRSGLPRRPWYIHHVYAPGFYTGYGVKTLPAVREAIEQKNWKEAEEQVRITAAALLDYAAEVDRATKLMAIEAPRP